MSKKHNMLGYTTQEAADEVGDIKVSRVRQLVAQGLIDHQKVGKTVLISEKGMKALMNRKKTPGPVAGAKVNRGAAVK